MGKMPETKKSKEIAERKPEFKTTIDGTTVNRVYTPADVAGVNQEDVGLPGEYPFVRRHPLDSNKPGSS